MSDDDKPADGDKRADSDHEHDWYWYKKGHQRGDRYWDVEYRCAGCPAIKHGLQDWQEP